MINIFLLIFFDYVFGQTRPTLAPTTYTYTFNNFAYNYDFSTLQISLTSQSDYTLSSGGFSWFYNIAGGVLPSTCSSCASLYLSPVLSLNNCLMIQVTALQNGYCTGAVNSQTVSTLTNDPTTTGNGIKLTYSGGSICSAIGASRKTYINLKCDPTGTLGSPQFVSVQEITTCVYSFIFNAKEGCFTTTVPSTIASLTSFSSLSSSNNNTVNSSTSSDTSASVNTTQIILISVIIAFLLLLGLIIIRFNMKRSKTLTKPIILNSNMNSDQPQYGPMSSQSGNLASNHFRTQYAPHTQYGTNYLQPTGQFGTTYAQNTMPIQFGTNYSGLPSSHFANYPQSNIAAGLPPSTGLNSSTNSGNSSRTNIVSSSTGNSGLITSSVMTQLSTSVPTSQSGNMAFPGAKGAETAIMEQFSGMTTVQQGPLVMALPGHLKVTLSSVEFRLGKKIGAGGGGEIYYVDLLDNSSELANRAKSRKLIAKVMKEAGEKMFNQEVSIMAMFNSHKNFAELIGFESDSMSLIMVFYEKGAFDGWIKKTQNRSFSNIFSVISGTFSALSAMHGCGIVHNDIKPANILLDTDSDGMLIARLTDFGICQVVENTTLLVSAFEVKSIRGWSLRYAAPERLATNAKINAWDKVRVSKAADIYSMGITIWEALCGDIPLF